MDWPLLEKSFHLSANLPHHPVFIWNLKFYAGNGSSRLFASHCILLHEGFDVILIEKGVPIYFKLFQIVCICISISALGVTLDGDTLPLNFPSIQFVPFILNVPIFPILLCILSFTFSFCSRNVIPRSCIEIEQWQFYPVPPKDGDGVVRFKVPIYSFWWEKLFVQGLQSW